jgi:hypothetical protein
MREGQAEESVTDLDDHANDTTANRNMTKTDTDVGQDERLRSGGATFDVALQQQILAGNNQLLTLQAQMNSNFANLQASNVAAMAQAVNSLTAISQSSENQKQRCVDHSEEAQHKTIQATIPVGGDH